MSRKQKEFKNILINFDTEQLDLYELQDYKYHLKTMSKSESLMMLINGEHDSPLSDGLTDLIELFNESNT